MKEKISDLRISFDHFKHRLSRKGWVLVDKNEMKFVDESFSEKKKCVLIRERVLEKGTGKGYWKLERVLERVLERILETGKGT